MPRRKLPKDKTVYDQLICPDCGSARIELSRVVEVVFSTYFNNGEVDLESGESGNNGSIYKFDLACCMDCSYDFRLDPRIYSDYHLMPGYNLG
jgi:hypothetical protein